MEQVVTINLDNEMDLILSHRRTMKLVELCGLSMSSQTTFATAVSEIARVAISHGKNSYLTLNIDALERNKKEIAAILYDKVDLESQNSEAFIYARRLMGSLDVSVKDGWYQYKLLYRINFAGLISKARINGFKEYFEHEPPLSAYDEIRKKNIQLIQLNDKLTESEKNLRLSADELKELSNKLEEKVQHRTLKLNEANELLELKNRELNRQNEELASFTYVASHDLQEPLRKIHSFISRILVEQNTVFSEKTMDYFNRITNASVRMQSLIDALLNYSRTNTSEKIFTKTDLNKTIENVKSDLRESIEEKNATITVSTLPVVPVITHQFQQLLTNIISNSLKYSKPSLPPQVQITAKMVSENEIQHLPGVSYSRYWKISIADNGIGFEQQYEHKIFELFQRLHGRSEYSGTGIGLAICKKIVQNHDGILTAEGRLNQGATFHIYIPER